MGDVVMKRQTFLYLCAVITFFLAIILTLFVSHVGQRWLFLFPSVSDVRDTDKEIHMSISANYSGVGDVIVSFDQENNFDNIWNDPYLNIDISVGAYLNQFIIIDNVSNCYPHTGDGNKLNYSKGTTISPSSVMSIDKIKNSDMALMYMKPNSQIGRYWVKCISKFRKSDFRRTFVRRRINFSYEWRNTMFENLKNKGDISLEELEKYSDLHARFADESKGLWYKSVIIYEKISNAENIDLIGGKVPEIGGEDFESDHARFVNSVDQGKLSINWDDSRFMQLRDIILVLIGGLFGLGLSLFVEALRPSTIKG
jgi:hypothetical protein